MTVWVAPVAPLFTAWWDAPTILASVLAKLRLTNTDIDVARITALVPAAGYQINRRLDRTVALDAAQVVANTPALVDLVIAMYLPPVRSLDGGFVRPLDTISLVGRERRGVA